MRKLLLIVLSWVLAYVATGSLGVASAQTDHPAFQVVTLNSIEPPPPGIAAELTWGGWGAGPAECDVPLGYFIVGTGFSPALPKTDFAIRIYCVSAENQPIRIAFYQLFARTDDEPLAKQVATRELYADANGELWVQVKVGRSAPFSFANLVAAFYTPRWGAIPLRPTLKNVSHCVGSQSASLQVGDSAIVSPGEPNVLRAQPNPTSQKLGLIPAETFVTVIGGPQCAPNGMTFWRVRYGKLEGWTAQGNREETWLY